MNLTVGSIVLDSENNEYRLTEQLGKGGFGAVYKAIRIKDNSTVAVKVFSSDFPSPESMLSFQKELQQSLLVKSENVIEYFYAHDGSVFNELPPFGPRQRGVSYSSNSYSNSPAVRGVRSGGSID